MILDQNAFALESRFIGRSLHMAFRRERPDIVEKLIAAGFVDDAASIYIHIPFCRGLCPACPYVRYLWKDDIARKYLEALLGEIQLYGELLRDLDLKITDIHVGGGTPSLLDPEIYGNILETLKDYFNLDVELSFGIEANPEDISEEKAFRLRESGVNEISLGIQSFYRANLKTLGRRHSVEDSIDAIENVEAAGFDGFNIDMMYMLPKQTVEEWIEDLKLAIEFEPTQITIYPLLIVPYRPMYMMMKSGKVPEQPGKRVFKQMYYKALETLEDSGYKPMRYYSFSREPWEYTTVEREMVGPLIAFGAGAMGFPGHSEYVNTCSIREYVKAISKSRLPIAGIRKVEKEERGIRWISERLSALKLNFIDFKKVFDEEFEDFIKRTGYRKSLIFQRLLGNIKQYADHIEVTRKGMFSRNLSGWAFVLSIPCKIVEEYLKTPWPREVKIP